MADAFRLDRRSFLALAPAAFVQAPARSGTDGGTDTADPAFPLQHRDLVREVVGAAHGDIGRVKALVVDHPTLARASWDWGFGDHEAAIDAASHVGNRPIAEFLIANGARPTIFTAAMLGQLSVVRGMIEALPGVQRTRGPHGITMVAHARAGGPAAADVVSYLERLGDANPTYADAPVPPGDDALIQGEYVFGNGAGERLVVARNSRGELTLARPGVMSSRRLFHQGGLVFNPPGAEAVKLTFDVTNSRSVTLRLQDGPESVTARRSAPPGV